MAARSSSSDLSRSLLASVSRSFYLTLRALPGDLREPLSVAYLLARASDTIADSATAPAAQRLDWLQRLAAAIDGENAAWPVAGLAAGIDSPHPGERHLIARLEDCLAWLNRLDAADREEIRVVLRRIIRGQSLDVERFGHGPASLPDAAALDDYTWLVAGCVGAFWTRLCFRHLKRYSDLPPEKMTELGVAFGKGLQLVNILRDLPADLAEGRSYLPGPPEERAAMFEHWMKIASRHLDAAFEYVEAVRSLRVRYACFLPWYLGVRTLDVLRREPPLVTGRKAKVPRSEVRVAMVLGAAAAVSNAPLRRVRARLAARV